MRSKKLSSPTIVLITDRTDLDDQLPKSFLNATKFIGDKTIVQVESREKLKEHLKKRTAGGVYLTTIQKFEESTGLLLSLIHIFLMSVCNSCTTKENAITRIPQHTMPHLMT